MLAQDGPPFFDVMGNGEQVDLGTNSPSSPQQESSELATLLEVSKHRLSVHAPLTAHSDTSQGIEIFLRCFAVS